MADPVASSVGMGGVNLTKLDVDVEAVVQLGVDVLRIENDADGKDIVYLLKGDVLRLHLVPDGVRRLDALFDFVVQAELVKFSTDRRYKLLKSRVTLFLRGLQLALDNSILIGMLELETQILELGFDGIETQSVGEWRIDVERLASNLVLLVDSLTAEGAHVVEAVCNLNEDDANVIAHRQQEFFEVLRLSRSMVTKDST